VIAGHYEKRDPKGNPSSFSAPYAKPTSRFLKSLSPDQWETLWPRHAERGQESIEHIVRMIAGHDINHISQIERILTPKK